jgi:purine-binding chemotaxis protein CheW
MAEEVPSSADDITRLLHERAAQLARRERDSDEATLLPHVAFQAAGQQFAVPLRYVVYASRLRHLTPIPGGPPYLLGICALAGHLVSVLDVAAFLDLRQRGLSDVACCLVVSYEGRELGLCAERLLGIEDVPAAAISPWQGGSSMIPQMATLPKLRLLLLDLPQLLSDPRLQEEQQ